MRTLPRAGSFLTPLLALTAAAACGDDPPTRVVDATPSGVVLAANPRNALSGIVTFRAEGADSARAVYTTGSGAAAVTRTTPWAPVREGAGRLVLLGLRPGTSYDVVVEAAAGGAARRSAAHALTSGELPQPLRGLRLEVSAGRVGAGYILTAPLLDALPYVVAFDSTGAVVWYHELREGGLLFDAKQHVNGDFTVYVGNSNGWQPTFGEFVQFRADGQEVRRIVAPAPFYTDSHELLLTFRDTVLEAAHLFGYTIRTTSEVIGGRPVTRLAGHQILRLDPAGAPRFFWDAWDHIDPSEVLELPVLDGQDFDHPNSLDIDPTDGNYVVSWRQLAQVMKVDARNGRIIWRLGGVRGDLRILDDPLGGFSAQHYAKILDNGNLLLFDNGTRHTPPQSRAVEYQIDTVARTARMVWEYRHSPPLYSIFVGSAQRLTSGNTLISYGFIGRMVEATAARGVAWDGRLFNNQSVVAFYRAVRIPSLYRYERP